MDKKTFNERSPNRGQNKGPDKLGLAVEEILQELIIVSSIGTWTFIKLIFSRWFWVPISILMLLSYHIFYVVVQGEHMVWLFSIEPNYITTTKNLGFLWHFPVWQHFIVVFSLYFYPVLLVFGYYNRAVRVKYQKIFQKVGITNPMQDTPKLIRINKIDAYRKSYVFDSNGLGVSDFEQKRDRIESAFGIPVESIKHGQNLKHIIVTLTEMVMPSSVNYNSLMSSEVLPKESFFLGVSESGTLTQKITELPHMLIAGSTGSGKSVFFKQALMGLLESSEHIQMYLIDLKGGLEMTDFAASPNVKVIKSIDDAVTLLKQVNGEMKSRFDYLEKNGLKNLVPERDKKDRIVVAVDESSVLYMNRPRIDKDYGASIEARQLADSIAKLARAAGIHLLLATQKLDKQVIPTSVSENISGRMAFRANSLQGSLVVLGTKEAMELPEIPGRGIWSFGTKKVTLQAPFIEEKTIQARCKVLANEFSSGKRKCFDLTVGKKEEKKKRENLSDMYRKGTNSEGQE